MAAQSWLTLDCANEWSQVWPHRVLQAT
jgi:hypothetical protein